jgi:hypothetical protein
MKIFQSDFFQDDSQVYPSIQTSTTLTQPPSEELTSSQADSRANRSVLPGSKEARRMTVGSGRKCSELLSKHNPLGSLLKTLLVSSTWHSTRCYLTWKPKTTPRGRLYFQLAVKMPSTAETESGSLQGMWELQTSDNPNIRRSRSQKRVSPRNQVQMWPTPRATDFKGAGPGTNDQSIQKRLDNGTKNLSETVQAAEGDVAHSEISEHKDCGPVGLEESHAHMLDRKYLCAATKESDRPTGKLNPQWVEWLMGLPSIDGETDLGKTEFPE